MQDISKLRDSERHRKALAHLSAQDVSETTSEAAFLHAIMGAGIKAVSEQVEEAGYAEIAENYDAPARKALARRRRPSWAEE